MLLGILIYIPDFNNWDEYKSSNTTVIRKYMSEIKATCTEYKDEISPTLVGYLEKKARCGECGEYPELKEYWGPRQRNSTKGRNGSL